MKRVAATLAFVGLLFIAPAARADLVGICNSLLGHLAGNEFRVLQGNTAQCSDLAATINDIVETGCVPLLDSGQLFVAHIRSDLPLVQAACTALVCDCGFVIPECGGVVSCS